MIEIPSEMTMDELRDFTVNNGLWYSHVYKGKGRVRIYRDRYKYPRDMIGETFVTDYRPIKNFKAMRSGSNYQAMQIFKKRIKKRDWGYCLSIVKPEEVEAIKNWLEGKK